MSPPRSEIAFRMSSSCPPLRRRPLMMSKLSSSTSRRRTSGRYQPAGGAGRRTRRFASRAPRRSRIRAMVRTDGRPMYAPQSYLGPWTNLNDAEGGGCTLADHPSERTQRSIWVVVAFELAEIRLSRMIAATWRAAAGRQLGRATRGASRAGGRPRPPCARPRPGGCIASRHRPRTRRRGRRPRSGCTGACCRCRQRPACRRRARPRGPAARARGRPRRAGRRWRAPGRGAMATIGAPDSSSRRRARTRRSPIATMSAELRVAGGGVELRLEIRERRHRVELEREPGPGDPQIAGVHGARPSGGRRSRRARTVAPIATVSSHGVPETHLPVPWLPAQPCRKTQVRPVASSTTVRPCPTKSAETLVGMPEPGCGRVAAVRQDRPDRSAVRAVEADDHDLRVDQALGQVPQLLRRAAVAMDRPTVGQLRPAISGDALDEPAADGDPGRAWPRRRPRRRPRRPPSRARRRSRRRGAAGHTAGAAPGGRR